MELSEYPAQLSGSVCTCVTVCQTEKFLTYPIMNPPSCIITDNTLSLYQAAQTPSLRSGVIMRGPQSARILLRYNTHNPGMRRDYISIFPATRGKN